MSYSVLHFLNFYCWNYVNVSGSHCKYQNWRRNSLVREESWVVNPSCCYQVWKSLALWISAGGLTSWSLRVFINWNHWSLIMSNGRVRKVGTEKGSADSEPDVVTGGSILFSMCHIFMVNGKKISNHQKLKFHLEMCIGF